MSRGRFEWKGSRQWKMLVPLLLAGTLKAAGRQSALSEGEACVSGKPAFDRRGQEASAGILLRVATFNVHGGGNIPLLAQSIEASPSLRAADVLMIQEIEQRLDLDGPKELAGSLGLEFVYAPARPIPHGTHGLAILSRHPIRDPEIFDLERFDLGYHSRRRIALAATIETRGVPLRLYNVHLDTRLNLEQRTRQLRPVLEQALAQPRAVVGGDLNTIRAISPLLPFLPLPLPGLGQASALDDLLRRMGFATPFAEIGATGPLGMRLDGLFPYEAPVVGYGKEAGIEVSDHLPLWIDLELPLEDEAAPLAPVAAPH